ncbi:hypothetical protein MTO96_039325 [Rhipicephalus appendiculatus]
MATSSAGARPETGAVKDDDDPTSRLNGYPELLGDCKLSASSSSEEDSSSSSGTSSASSSSSSDSTSSDDEMQAGASHSEDVDVEDVPTGVPSGSAAVVMAAIEPQVGIHVQRIVDRPKDMPSDHADDVHDWVGWPTFPPPKDDGDRQQRPIVVTKVPHIAHINRHEFLPKMELQINTQGRFMQPAPSFRLTNLMDDLQYTVWLTFTELHGGACAGQFTHPESPRPGSLWNGKVVSFARLKLFSNDGFIHHPPPITLKCSTTYRIQVNLGVVNDGGHILSATVVRQFVGGIFFAVIQTAKKSS